MENPVNPEQNPEVNAETSETPVEPQASAEPASSPADTRADTPVEEALGENSSSEMEVAGGEGVEATAEAGAAEGGAVQAQASPEGQKAAELPEELAGLMADLPDLPPESVPAEPRPRGGPKSSASPSSLRSPRETPVRSVRPERSAGTTRYSQNIRRILDIELPVVVSFGSAKRPLSEILKLSPGTILELDKFADDPVLLKVNNKIFARGEVVDVDGYYGVQITEITSQEQRLASLGEGDEFSE